MYIKEVYRVFHVIIPFSQKKIKLLESRPKTAKQQPSCKSNHLPSLVALLTTKSTCVCVPLLHYEMNFRKECHASISFQPRLLQLFKNIHKKYQVGLPALQTRTTFISFLKHFKIITFLISHPPSSSYIIITAHNRIKLAFFFFHFL